MNLPLIIVIMIPLLSACAAYLFGWRRSERARGWNLPRQAPAPVTISIVLSSDMPTDVRKQAIRDVFFASKGGQL